MVPKLHKKGSSFKGAAAYLLHDKGRADTSERVAWTETRNLATGDNGELAWRVMAATAMDQARLKQQAGVKNTGRKSIQHALHLSLSWHADEAPNLDRQAMIGAAEAAITALGANDRQALIVSHSDEEQPHVHVLVNRVSPEDGRMLSSSKEKLNLSAWAEKYEKERGQVYCDQRVINNAARNRGEYTRGAADVPRHIYELEQRAPANDNAFKAMRSEQRCKDAKLSTRGRELAQQQKASWAKLDDTHKQQINSIRSDTRQAVGREQARVRKAFRSRWTAHYHDTQARMRAFEQREETLLGRIANRFKSVDLGKLVSGESTGQTLSEAFSAFTTKAGRKAAETRRTEAQKTALRREQAKAEEAAIQKLRHREKQSLAANRHRYLTKRADIVLNAKMEQAKHRAEWKQRNQERKTAHARYYDPIQNQTPSAQQTTAEQNNAPAASPKASALLPKQGANKRTEQIDQYKDLAAKRAKRKRQRNRDRDDDRGR